MMVYANTRQGTEGANGSYEHIGMSHLDKIEARVLVSLRAFGSLRILSRECLLIHQQNAQFS